WLRQAKSKSAGGPEGPVRATGPASTATVWPRRASAAAEGRSERNRRRKSMKAQRLLIVLTIVNLALLVFLLAQTRIHIGLQGVRVWTNPDGSVLRGRALEIIDDQGRTRAAISVHPADQITSYPETVILRLIDQNGRPSVKLSTSDQGGLLALV